MDGVYAPTRDWYVDYDDIAISTTGYIGLLSTDTIAPATAAGMSVTTP